MGGSTERLNVIPILTVEGVHVRAPKRFARRSTAERGCEQPSSYTRQRAGIREMRKRFEAFDARRAACFKLEESLASV
jgi:hypothetical protein